MLSIADIKTAVEPVVKNTKVEKIVLFGSYAKGTANERSDIDLYMDSNMAITGLAFFGLRGRIEDALGVEVDLIADLSVLPNSPIETQINESGVLIYERQG